MHSGAAARPCVPEARPVGVTGGRKRAALSPAAPRLWQAPANTLKWSRWDQTKWIFLLLKNLTWVIFWGRRKPCHSSHCGLSENLSLNSWWKAAWRWVIALGSGPFFHFCVVEERVPTVLPVCDGRDFNIPALFHWGGALVTLLDTQARWSSSKMQSKKWRPGRLPRIQGQY